MSEAPAAGRSTRATPAWLVAVAAVLLLARVGTGVLEHLHPPGFTERVEWQEPGEAGRLAAASGRAILYDFSAEWCGPCRSMARDIFADSKAAAHITRAFVPVRVLDRSREDGRNTALVDSLQKAFHVTAFPTLVAYYPADGHTEIQVGYPGPGATRSFLARAASRGLTRRPFDPGGASR